MKPSDKWVPVVVQKDQVKVHIYRHYLKHKGLSTYLVQCHRHGHRYRCYRANLNDAMAEARKLADEIASDELQSARISLKDINYYLKCKKALGKTPLHVAVAFYVTHHAKPQE